MIASLRWKVALGALLSVILGLGVAGWLTLQSAEQTELTRLNEALEARTSLTTSSLLPLLQTFQQPPPTPQAPPDETGSPSAFEAARADLQLAVRAVSRQAAARVTIISRDGTVLADSATPDEMVPRLPNHGARPEVVAALSSGRGSDLRLSETVGQRMMYVARPYSDDRGETAGVVRLALPLTTVEHRVGEVHRALGVAFGVAFLVALMTSWIVARGLVRPVAEMADAARRLGAGAFDLRLDIRSRDEVGVLADTLNQMADQLETKIRQVSEDRAQLLAMLTAMVEGVMVLDVRGKILQVNPALEQMFQIKADEARGRLYWEVIRHPGLNELANRVLRSHRNVGVEIHLTPGGRALQVEASVSGYQRENEACAVLVFHDITALRRLEKIRKDFVANVSHEIRTPLTSIKGYVEALLDGVKDDPDQAAKFLTIILTQTDRLNLILEDLLQLSQIESGQVLFKRMPVQLRTVVNRTLAALKPQAEKKGHTVTVAIPEEVPAALGDEDRLVQVATNLLDNAIKYTPERGAITIAARTAGTGAVELTVTDTGIGIPEPDRPRVFERFYRVDKARSRELGGTGLGLAIVKHIVEGHRGRVWVEGQLPKGSRFIVHLPSASDSPDADHAEENPQ